MLQENQFQYNNEILILPNLAIEMKYFWMGSFFTFCFLKGTYLLLWAYILSFYSQTSVILNLVYVVYPHINYYTCKQSL